MWTGGRGDQNPPKFSGRYISIVPCASHHELVVEEDPLDGDLRGARAAVVVALLAVHEQDVQLLVLCFVVTFNRWT